MLCKEKKEHQLPLAHPQTGGRVHPGLHKQVWLSGPANYSMDAVLQNFRRSFRPTTPFFQSLSLDPPETMEELYRQADKFSMLEDNIRTASQTVMITTQKNKPAAKGPPEQKCSQGKSQKLPDGQSEKKKDPPPPPPPVHCSQHRL